MKKLLLLFSISLGFAANAQSDRLIGVHFGAPVGDAADISTLNFGVDCAVLFYVTDEFYAGASGAFTRFVGKEVAHEFGSSKIESFNFIYLAGSAEYSFDKLFAVVDLGYAFCSGNTDLGMTGLYYQPKIGYHIIEGLDIHIGYKSFLLGGQNIGAFGGGLSYRY
ncbi:hypothetical protein [Flavobacterium sp. AG291]|uniref:hypothetical protein n=1 Tax=Flavobacterium sp. AG291 TaxID=2184000 RepID=UPI000E0B23FC|nr:hypothetical protein [Flavobacterium sp. AG291]RDI09775.1 hypothetical protein DEU42_10971 [Flavobacterium sp. AG291]